MDTDHLGLFSMIEVNADGNRALVTVKCPSGHRTWLKTNFNQARNTIYCADKRLVTWNRKWDSTVDITKVYFVYSGSYKWVAFAARSDFGEYMVEREISEVLKDALRFAVAAGQTGTHEGFGLVNSTADEDQTEANKFRAFAAKRARLVWL